MTNIVSMIFEARINSLIKKRDEAIRIKDYDRAAVLNMKISNNINRRLKWC